MRITRRTFLVATTAFTAVALFHPIASAPIDPDHLQRDHWYHVWYQPVDKPAIKTGRFSGIDHYALPENSFLTLDNETMRKLKTAKAGEGLKGGTTVHILPDQDRDFFG